MAEKKKTKPKTKPEAKEKAEKNPTEKHAGGRPRLIELDKSIVLKLESAFAIGATVTLACAFAGIRRQVYYDIIRDYPEYSDKFENLKQKPILKALNTVVGSLDDPKVATWYLTKKMSQDFGNTIDVGIKKEKPIDLSDLTDEQVMALAEQAIKEGI